MKYCQIFRQNSAKISLNQKLSLKIESRNLNEFKVYKIIFGNFIDLLNRYF